MLRLSNDRRMSFALNEDLLLATVVRAMNRVNGYALGVRRSRRQARLDALAWSERGRVSGRLHVHALIERPLSIDEFDFAEMIGRAWRAQPFGYDEVRIEALRSIERSIRYNSKASPSLTGNLVYFHREEPGTAWWR